MRKAIAICVSVAALAMGSSSLAPVQAQPRSYDRAERSTRDGPTANQLVDEADSRIARLKADLRLTPEQAEKWGDLQKVLHDRAVRSADAWIKLREEIADQRERAREERRRYSNRSDRDAPPPSPRPDANPPATPPGPTSVSPAPGPVGNNDKSVASDRPADTRADTTRTEPSRTEPSRADPDDDIASMRRRADALTAMAADLRQIADAGEPLYKLLDQGQRHVLIRFVTASDREQSAEPRRRYRR